MIVKTKRGYKVTSEDGTKDLSADDLTEEEARKRLAQIEYWKAQSSPSLKRGGRR